MSHQFSQQDNGPPNLTDEQVRSERFEVPAFIIALAFGARYAAFIETLRYGTVKHGGVLNVFGWPDGTTITWTRGDPNEPLDLDAITECYRSARALRDLELATVGQRGH